jgi:gamma-glutamylaminecyclotransferase
MTPSTPIRVFVYGTLKRGGANHAFMAGQTCLGAARTPAGFTLYGLGGYPGMVRDTKDRDGVTGELWLVDADGLARLDELEGVGEGLYERVTLSLAPPHDDEPVQAYLYRRSVAARPRVGSSWPV